MAWAAGVLAWGFIEFQDVRTSLQNVPSDCRCKFCISDLPSEERARTEPAFWYTVPGEPARVTMLNVCCTGLLDFCPDTECPGWPALGGRLLCEVPSLGRGLHWPGARTFPLPYFAFHLFLSLEDHYQDRWPKKRWHSRAPT
jgi:hypothetical protein